MYILQLEPLVFNLGNDIDLYDRVRLVLLPKGQSAFSLV